MNPYCVKCGRSMLLSKKGTFVTKGPGLDRPHWGSKKTLVQSGCFGDFWECPSCLARIVIGSGPSVSVPVADLEELRQMGYLFRRKRMQ